MENERRLKISLKIFLLVALLCSVILSIVNKNFCEGLLYYLHTIITPYPIIFSIGAFVQRLFLKFLKPPLSKNVEFNKEVFSKILSFWVISSLITISFAYIFITESAGDYGFFPPLILLPLAGFFFGILSLGCLFLLTRVWIKDTSDTPLIYTSIASFILYAIFFAFFQLTQRLETILNPSVLITSICVVMYIYGVLYILLSIIGLLAVLFELSCVATQRFGVLGLVLIILLVLLAIDFFL